MESNSLEVGVVFATCQFYDLGWTSLLASLSFGV